LASSWCVVMVGGLGPMLANALCRACFGRQGITTCPILNSVAQPPQAAFQVRTILA
jgi:hypothetical protein